jgi:hypothetical protein
MLGIPYDGSWAPMQVLSGDDNFGQVLTALGAPSADSMIRMIYSHANHSIVQPALIVYHVFMKPYIPNQTQTWLCLLQFC